MSEMLSMNDLIIEHVRMKYRNGVVISIKYPFDYSDFLFEKEKVTGPQLNRLANSDVLFILMDSKDQAISFVKSMPKGRPFSKQVWEAGKMLLEI